MVTNRTTGTREAATKASWRVDDLPGKVTWLRTRGVEVQDLPELGTADGVADLGFAPAAWLTPTRTTTPTGPLRFKQRRPAIVPPRQDLAAPGNRRAAWRAGQAAVNAATDH